MAAVTKQVPIPLRLIHSSVRLLSHHASDPHLSQSEPQTQSSFSSNFSEVKASLQQQKPKNRHKISPAPISFSNSELARSPPSKIVSLGEIRHNLAEFRARSAAPPPSTGRSLSFEELYKRNVIPSSGDSNFAETPSTDPASYRKPSLDFIHESLRGLQATPGKIIDPIPLARLKDQLKAKAVENIKDSLNRAEDSTVSAPVSTKFMKSYDYTELGEMLRSLRPEKQGKWFSLQELSERLVKLREFEKNNTKVIGSLSFTDLRHTLSELSISQDDKAREKTMHRLNILSHLGGTPSFMLSPPKEHLVEKYFHPDNLSSAEKLKLELKKVRDEFKMSESDCGSTRVQIAELTTRIKYLSTALQKKDKHSRKGLQTMVQRRKKMLKYLRRTDWDSYAMLLSKLGLRDNPDTRSKT